MIEINYDDEFNLKCKGTINLGILGCFNEDMIEIQGQYDCVDLERMSKEERREECNRLNIEYNEFLSCIEKNLDTIKNQFIVWLFSYLLDIDFEFWEYEDMFEFINEESMPEIRDAKNIYSKVSGENYGQVCSEVLNKKYNEVDGKEIFKKYLPMVNIDKLMMTIIPFYVELNQYGLEFEINSNVCEGELLCATVGSINREIELEIIDN